MKFEYTLLNMAYIREKGMISLESALNRLGRDGWELVGIDVDLYVFKRKVE